MKNYMSASLNLEGQFNIFTQEFNKWCKVFGLNDWDIKKIEQKSIESSKGALAEVEYDMVQKDVNVVFYGSIERNYDISEAAKHEALHLVLAECTTNETRQHSVINRLTKLIRDTEE